MNMVMDRPAQRVKASGRTRSSQSAVQVESVSRANSEGLNLKGRLSESPEVYTGLQRQPYGE